MEKTRIKKGVLIYAAQNPATMDVPGYEEGNMWIFGFIMDEDDTHLALAGCLMPDDDPEESECAHLTVVPKANIIKRVDYDVEEHKIVL